MYSTNREIFIIKPSVNANKVIICCFVASKNGVNKNEYVSYLMSDDNIKLDGMTNQRQLSLDYIVIRLL